MTALATAMDEYLAHLGVEKGVSPHTLEAYRGDLVQYRVFLEQRTITFCDQISRQDVLEFVGSLRTRGYASATVERKLSAIKTFHTFIHREDIVSHNPATKLPRMHAAQLLPDVLSIASLTSILESLQSDETPLGLRNRAVFEVLYGCGLRVSELCALDVVDIDFEASMLRVTGKGSKQRIVPLGSIAAEALTTYLEEGRHHLHRRRATAPVTSAVFLTTTGRRMYRESVYRVVRDICEQAGFKGIHPHTLRHSYATHMLEGGADLRSLQEMLGHADLATTQIYTHVDQSHLLVEYLGNHPRARRRPEGESRGDGPPTEEPHT